MRQMRITPRYEGAAVINVDAVVRSPSAALVRQRARLAESLRGLSTEEWNAPSRCGGWTVQDVVEHLAGVNRFWSLSIQAGLRGEPTRLLASFDPVRVPAAMVQAARGASASATLDSFQATNAQLGTLVGSLTDAGWDKRAEAPPGHLAIRAVALHALWDSWVHERDILVPLSRQQAVEFDEVLLSLAYAAALGPGLRAAAGSTSAGSLGVIGRHPEIELTVEAGSEVTVHLGVPEDADATIEGDAVQLLEALSLRAPRLPIAEKHRWLLAGLDEAFDAGTYLGAAPSAPS
jgi:uncharacterized protein (TIGR03083 family)